MKTVIGGINPSIIDDPIARRYWEIVKTAFSEISSIGNVINNINYPGAAGTFISHHDLLDLTDGDDHTQYLLLANRVGGQVINVLSTSDIPLTIQGLESHSVDLQRWMKLMSGVNTTIGAIGTKIGSVDQGSGVLSLFSGDPSIGVRTLTASNSYAFLFTVNPLDVSDFPSNALLAIHYKSAPLGINSQFLIEAGGTTYPTQTGVNSFFISTSSGANTDRIIIDNLWIRGHNAAANVLLKFGQFSGTQTGDFVQFLTPGPTFTQLTRIDSTGTWIGPLAPTLLSVADNVFSIFDNTTTSKIGQFELDGLTAGTHTYRLPPTTAASTDTLAALGIAQTFLAEQTIEVPGGNTALIIRDSIGGFSTAITGVNFSQDRLAAFPDGNGFVILSAHPNVFTSGSGSLYFRMDNPVSVSPIRIRNAADTFDIFYVDADEIVSFFQMQTFFFALIDNAFGSGFRAILSPKEAFTQDFNIQLRNIPGPGVADMVYSAQSQLAFDIILDTSTSLYCDTTSSGATFADKNSTTKRVRVVLSESKILTNSALVFANTVSNQFRYPDTSGIMMMDTATITYDDDVITYEDNLVSI